MTVFYHVNGFGGAWFITQNDQRNQALYFTKVKQKIGRIFSFKLILRPSIFKFFHASAVITKIPIAAEVTSKQMVKKYFKGVNTPNNSLKYEYWLTFNTSPAIKLSELYESRFVTREFVTEGTQLSGKLTNKITEKVRTAPGIQTFNQFNALRLKNIEIGNLRGHYIFSKPINQELLKKYLQSESKTPKNVLFEDKKYAFKNIYQKKIKYGLKANFNLKKIKALIDKFKFLTKKLSNILNDLKISAVAALKVGFKLVIIRVKALPLFGHIFISIVVLLIAYKVINAKKLKTFFKNRLEKFFKKFKPIFLSDDIIRYLYFLLFIITLIALLNYKKMCRIISALIALMDENMSNMREMIKKFLKWLQYSSKDNTISFLKSEIDSCNARIDLLEHLNNALLAKNEDQNKVFQKCYDIMRKLMLLVASRLTQHEKDMITNLMKDIDKDVRMIYENYEKRIKK